VMLRDADVPSPPLHAGWRSGTPQYMAPELWRGEEHSVAGDLYAAACLFAVAVTGHDPFEAEDISVLRRLHERGDIPGATLAAPVRGLLVEGMAKDPRQRPSDASRYRADLEVAAAAYLDEGWRTRGRAALAALVHERLAAPAVPAAATEFSDDEALAASAAASAAAGRGFAWLRNGRILAAALAAALVLAVMVVVVASALTAPPAPVDTPAPVPIATPTVSPGSSASGGGPFTAQASPSLQYSGNPVPPSQTPLTPNASPAPPTLSVSSPTPTPTPTPTPVCIPLPTPCP